MAEFFPSHSMDSNNKYLVGGHLFGDRFFSDQGKVELLSEFLLVCYSEKEFNNDDNSKTKEIFPSLDKNKVERMSYFPEYRVGLKLFALYDHQTGGSVVEPFEEKYDEIINSLSSKIGHVLSENSDEDKKRVIEILRSLYRGFQEVGASRDWAAQSFLPVSKSLIAGESMFIKSNYKKNPKNAYKLLSHDRHSFYARGGEVLYLQLLAALNTPKEEIKNWFDNSRYKDMRISGNEKDPEYLRAELNKAFSSLYQGKTTQFFDNFAEKIAYEYKEGELDSGWNLKEKDREAKVAYIPSRTWVYGYIFAIELCRFFKSSFDIVELITHLENACILQEIRTMLAESSNRLGVDYPLIPVISPTSKDVRYKMISNEAFKNCQLIIKNALNEVALELPDREELTSTEESKYGHKLLTKIAKSIGFVQPPRGTSEYFTLSKDLIVYLVSSTLLPEGDMLTLDTFLKELKIRYGIVVDSEGFTESNKQVNKQQKINDPTLLDWFTQVLRECAYYVQLSDSLSLIKNSNIKG